VFFLTQEFIAMMLDNDNGMYYPNYGPGDQGIINKVGVQAWEHGSMGASNAGNP
jgi:hypothetical protein